MRNADCPIDFVITWVDGSDPNWLEEKRRCLPDSVAEEFDGGDARFRQWDTLKYLFRGIEECCPWVNRVHFVTWGHLPEWLNVENERLSIVRHEDFIPERYLPTFKSSTIEFNFHRIENLAEHFVNFNDDMLILKDASPDDFFHNGLPRETAIEVPSRISKGVKYFSDINNVGIINAHFNKRQAVKQNIACWYSLKYGKRLLHTLAMLGYPQFTGFYNNHLPYSFLKKSFEEAWEVEGDTLDQVCARKLRHVLDVNQNLMVDWQLATGQFASRSPKVGRAFHLCEMADVLAAADYIRGRKGLFACVNDTNALGDDYLRANETIVEALEEIFPTKSSFER